MKLSKIAQAAIGIYLLLPGPEDVAAGGITAGPSAVLGAALVASAFGVKLW